MTASPEAGSVFAGWSGAGCAGTGSCVVTLVAKAAVTATFGQLIPDDQPGPPLEMYPLTLHADIGSASIDTVSVAVPLRPGHLFDPSLLALHDDQDQEVAIQVEPLAIWPQDGSLRSVLMLFNTTLAQGSTQSYSVHIGNSRTVPDLTSLVAIPDGPVVGAFSPSLYHQGRLNGGPLSSVADNTQFAAYDVEMEDELFNMSPAYTSYGVSCGSTSLHRTYYDGIHAMYALFLRTGDPKYYRRAREEATFYRSNELVNVPGGMAIQTCQGAWEPSQPMAWGVIRRMLGQGMLDDYLISGDPSARDAALSIGEAFRQNLPALRNGSENVLRVTERNMGWTMLGLSAYYALDQRPEVKEALESVVDETIAWQSESTSGAFEHDLVRPDPDECSSGPNGGSPFMTSLLVDGLMDYYFLTYDARIADVVENVANWLHDSARTSDGTAFRYLWNCLSDEYDDSSTADLNLLIVHVYGAAYALTGEESFITKGDAMAQSGVENMYVGRPKQWNQAGRSFGKYLGYRVLDLSQEEGGS